MPDPQPAGPFETALQKLVAHWHALMASRDGPLESTPDPLQAIADHGRDHPDAALRAFLADIVERVGGPQARPHAPSLPPKFNIDETVHSWYPAGSPMDDPSVEALREPTPWWELGPVLLGTKSEPPTGFKVSGRQPVSGEGLPKNVKAAWDAVKTAVPFLASYPSGIRMMTKAEVADSEDISALYDDEKNEIVINGARFGQSPPEDLAPLFIHELSHAAATANALNLKQAKQYHMGKAPDYEPYPAYGQRAGEQQAELARIVWDMMNFGGPQPPIGRTGTTFGR